MANGVLPKRDNINIEAFLLVKFVNLKDTIFFKKKITFNIKQLTY